MKNNEIFPLVLESEKSIKEISEEDILARHQLIGQLQSLPKEAFSHMRHLQPQIGCLNRCSFCSQSAGTTLWFLDQKSLANLFAALKYVALEHYIKEHQPNEISSIQEILTPEGTFSSTFTMPKHGLIGYARTNHRPGVLFCYLDNDISIYPHLDALLCYALEDLGVQIRISTIGYSRKNRVIQAMHEMINQKHKASLAGVRLSISSYAYGWKDTKQSSQMDYVHDLSNFLKTYRPSFDYLGLGNRTACVELRFRPLLKTTQVQELWREGYHLIHASPYLLISKNSYQNLKLARVVQNVGGQLKVNREPYEYLLIKDQNICWEMSQRIFASFLNIKQIPPKTDLVELFQMQNDDGYYYAIAPNKKDGLFKAKQIYPQTETRPKSGYIDSERYFLNALLAHQNYPKTWRTIQEICANLREQATNLQDLDNHAVEYIKSEILPLIEGYSNALQLANYPPAYFFDKNFTIDTGTICNLGRAYSEFKDLVSRENLPLTPSHERSYGYNSSLAFEGCVWRLAVTPTLLSRSSRSIYGRRNEVRESPQIILEELDLQNTSSVQGQTLRKFFIPVPSVQTQSLKDISSQALIPGQREIPSEKIVWES